MNYSPQAICKIWAISNLIFRWDTGQTEPKKPFSYGGGPPIPGFNQMLQPGAQRNYDYTQNQPPPLIPQGGQQGMMPPFTGPPPTMNAAGVLPDLPKPPVGHHFQWHKPYTFWKYIILASYAPTCPNMVIIISLLCPLLGKLYDTDDRFPNRSSKFSFSTNHEF